MNASIDRHFRLNGAHNVRDLGGYQAGDAVTQWRRLFRADALHRLDATDIDALLEAGLRTVIDLRHAGELEQAPSPFKGSAEVRYINVSLFEQLVPTLTPGGQYADGDVLLDLYLKALALRGEAFRDVLHHIADADQGVVMFHCTAGKDRTGMIAALLLGAAGVDRDTIVADYALTRPAIEPIVAELLADAKTRGIDPEQFSRLLVSEPATMFATLDHIEAKHGGIAAYLSGIGVDAVTIGKLRSRLVAVNGQGEA
ncbi:tyrosine-protein phosphatase [Rhizobium mayense]|uniref:Tyrosine-protein phosphatase n=1 Tax=Rhizobium mayense TaxID=1312184 RepID=A0ABT7JZU5_9HYPH|nr:tyrosine-protein phosphatase [Rhizobium mayense]MDL2401880.1 tyrosine-protein phosphatase [Rhizobium mayense]